jgi:hypothetical protein
MYDDCAQNLSLRSRPESTASAKNPKNDIPQYGVAVVCVVHVPNRGRANGVAWYM